MTQDDNNSISSDKCENATETRTIRQSVSFKFVRNIQVSIPSNKKEIQRYPSSYFIHFKTNIEEKVAEISTDFAEQEEDHPVKLDNGQPMNQERKEHQHSTC